MLRTGPGPAATARQRAEHPATSFASWRRHYLLTAADPPLPTIEVRHDAHATAVAFGADPGGPDGMALMVNDKTDASTVGDLDTQMMLAHAPLLLAPHTARLLVIGHGSGITAGSALVHPVERADIVEISPAVLALDHLFAPVNHQVLSDRRVHVYVEDAQSFLRAVPRQYDVIISEPSNPWVAGVGNLFTREFFTLARARLAPGGVFTFWFHTYAQTDDTTALLLRTLGAVFPAAELFTDDAGSDVVAVASAEPLPVDFAVIERRFGVPGVRQDLARLRLPEGEPLAAFLTRHRLSQRGATSLAGPGPLNLVAREQLQYRGPRALFAGRDSFFVERRDPLLKPGLDPSATLFARYLHHRAVEGRPVRPEDLEAVAEHVEGRGGNGAQVAATIRRRTWR
jgi:spermidine synthase